MESYTMERTSLLLITVLQSVSAAAAAVDPGYYYSTHRQPVGYGNDRRGQQQQQAALGADYGTTTFPRGFVLQPQQHRGPPAFTDWTPVVLRQGPGNAAATAAVVGPPAAVDVRARDAPPDRDVVVTYAPPTRTTAVAFVTPLRPATAASGEYRPQNVRGDNNHRVADSQDGGGGGGGDQQQSSLPRRYVVNAEDGRTPSPEGTGGGDRVRLLLHRRRENRIPVADPAQDGKTANDEAPAAAVAAAGEKITDRVRRPSLQLVYEKKYVQQQQQQQTKLQQSPSARPPVRDREKISDFSDKFRENYLQFVAGDADEPEKNVDDRARPPQADATRYGGDDPHGYPHGDDDNRNPDAAAGRVEVYQNNNDNERVQQQVRDDRIAVIADGPERRRPEYRNRNEFAAADDAGQKKRLRGHGGDAVGGPVAVADEDRRLRGAAAVTDDGQDLGVRAPPSAERPHHRGKPSKPGQRRRKVHRTRRPHPAVAVPEENVVVVDDESAAGYQPPNDDGQNDSGQISYGRDEQRRYNAPADNTARQSDVGPAADDNDDDAGEAVEEQLVDGYGFGYTVLDESSGTDFGQWERREPGRSGTVTGQYRVRLPDGRTQTVEYNVGRGTGYRASVTYEGVQRHPAAVERYVPAADVEDESPPSE